MTRKVARDTLVDFETWEQELRPREQARVLELKRARRVHVGPYLTFLFENADTIRYQVQEMMRVERLVKESAIQHELDTYNELIGDEGELGCALLIEIEDPAVRDRLLRGWHGMERHWYVRTASGERIAAAYDPRQVGDGGRLSSVQYLKFGVGDQVPAAIGCDHPDYTYESPLTDAQRDALASDLARSDD